MSKRIVFTFDKKSLDCLDDLMKTGKFEFLADAVRAAVHHLATVERHRKDGKVYLVKELKKGEKVILLTE